MDLTWFVDIESCHYFSYQQNFHRRSYASFITATAARDGRVPVAWGSTGIRSSCSPAPTGPVVVVVFDEKVITAFGEVRTFSCPLEAGVLLMNRPPLQSVFAVGSIPALGLWNPAAALPLSAEHYKPDAPIWTGSAYLPSSTLVEFKVGLLFPQTPRICQLIEVRCVQNSLFANWRMAASFGSRVQTDPSPLSNAAHSL